MPSTSTSMLDGLSTSVAIKAPCVDVEDANITLAGLQGYTDGDRVLVIGQTDLTENGIYVATTGQWQRALDFDGARDVVQGTRVMIRGGSIDAAEYILTTSDPVIGTSDIVFELRFGAGITYAITATETAASGVPINYSFTPIPMDVARYNALLTGADDTAEIQAAINALNGGTIKGGAVVMHGDANSTALLSTSIAFPKRVSGDNHSRWYSLSGLGTGAGRLVATTGMANLAMLDASGTDINTLSYYRYFGQFYLNGNSIAQGGIDLQFNQHFVVERVFINGLDDGSGTGYGIKLEGCICAMFLGVKVHNIEGNGIDAGTSGSGNFFNANLLAGSSFLDVSKSGIYLAGGAGCAYIGNTFEFCDEYGARFSGYSATCGFFGGNYLEVNGLADIYIGEVTAANSLNVIGNYLNGYSAGISATSYTPILMKFADGVIIRGNTVAQAVKSTTGYYFLDANISGGSVINCVVEDNQVRAPFSALTAPNQIYNLPGTWVDFGNKVVDPRFVPLIQTNIATGYWPVWSFVSTGTGVAAVDNSTLVLGHPSLRLNRPAASTAQVSRIIALETGSLAKNRFVTLAIPAYCVAAASMLVNVTPNGTSPQATSLDLTSMTAGTQRMTYVMVFVPSDATQITLGLIANATGADYYFGEPCLYVGAQQWYRHPRN